MRLLNVWTLELEEFIGDKIPPYSILSHRWGEQEVSYKEYRKGLNQNGTGYKKIMNCCQFARNRRIWILGRHQKTKVDWIWVDTCCIDKRSSAELSEAINSMYSWYQNAEECYVHLCDFSSSWAEGTVPIGGLKQALQQCSWFERGWTLQELLAPDCTTFCDANWNVIGHICDTYALKVEITRESHGPDLSREVSKITRIKIKWLTKEESINEASVAQRMSWAAKRITTRLEDEAYCLLGIFEINMPLLYGEGRKAFYRLQEEIIRRSADQSIFAWELHTIGNSQALATYPGVLTHSDMIAPSVLCFSQCHDIVPATWYVGEHSRKPLSPYAITNQGLEICVKLKKIALHQNIPLDLYVLTLDYMHEDKPNAQPIRIPLWRWDSTSERFSRYNYPLPLSVDQGEEIYEENSRLIYIRSVGK